MFHHREYLKRLASRYNDTTDPRATEAVEGRMGKHACYMPLNFAYIIIRLARQLLGVMRLRPGAIKKTQPPYSAKTDSAKAASIMC